MSALRDLLDLPREVTKSSFVVRLTEGVAHPKEIIESAYGQVMAGGRPGQGRGALVWPGLLRRLDRLDPSYRT